MKFKWALMLSILALCGCEERYRYPCQDPENWEQKQCKKPFCSANGTCPEDLTHYEKERASKAPTFYATAPESKKGDCK
jgi:hypothetical protein